ncbi:hypothetical protein C0Q70_11223 [Pomacea canaliculata]|uniref:Uncharacterized protein n=1 Tax=Pomacea canaliculata TaxID=400727 RepID=A0A2T7P5C7_POMCA|nr:hypothetical protein C0Q70_11223 [Pomacea canaliculata]
MTLLTSVVKEIVPQHLTNQAFESQMSTNLADKVTHPLVIEAVVRAMYNLHEQCGIPFPENPTETIGEQLSRLAVREVRGLETILTVNGKIIPQSEIKVPSFVHKQEDSPKACIVYIEADADETHRKDFLNDLAAAMGPCQSFVIPSAGTYIPVSCHCYLDNSFYRFKDGEHVGFEVYDPCVEVDDPEETTPTYIFGVIRHEASGGGQEESNLLTKKYLVDLGSERGLSEISATRLYKFIRKVNIHGVQDVAVHSSSGTKLETPEPLRSLATS